jgi:hypothetical protein
MFYLSLRYRAKLSFCSRPIRHATGGLFPGIKHPEPEANHSLPSDMQPHLISMYGTSAQEVFTEEEQI